MEPGPVVDDSLPNVITVVICESGFDRRICAGPGESAKGRECGNTAQGHAILAGIPSAVIIVAVNLISWPLKPADASLVARGKTAWVERGIRRLAAERRINERRSAVEVS